MTRLFATTLFLSAALVFTIEPIIGKMLMPLVGGAVEVWITAMLFFQLLLLAGYVYAHGSLRLLGVRRQVPVHLALTALAFLSLPILITPGTVAGWTYQSNPAVDVLLLLCRRVGWPFFVLSATAPTVQHWFSVSQKHKDPFFLYAASNLGSLLALLAYPLVIEPVWGLQSQSTAWLYGVGIFFAFLALCAFYTYRGSKDLVEASATVEALPPDVWKQRAVWIALAFLPSSYMLGITQHVSEDIVALPFFWVLPLFVYLLSFVIVFASKPPISVAAASRWLPFGLTFTIVAVRASLNSPLPFVTAMHVVTFFLACIVCHGRLAEGRPGASRLTEFYLFLAIGGALGGLFNGLVAPLVFHRITEYPLALLATAFIRPRRTDGEPAKLGFDLGFGAGLAILAFGLIEIAKRVSPSGEGPIFAAIILVPGFVNYSQNRTPLRFALGILGIYIGASAYEGPQGITARATRNFYGVVRVTHDSKGQFTKIVHGDTVHGAEYTDPAKQDEPLTYYGKSGPLGDIMRMVDERSPALDVAVIGLGAGTSAAYARGTDRLTFYELNPAVVTVAERGGDFHFVADAEDRGTKVTMVLGDARLRLEDAPSASYDMLVVDAFNSDAIPNHLLTAEAMRLYSSKLRSGGFLAFHISNRFIDLRPVLNDAAHLLKLVSLMKNGEFALDNAVYPASWAVLAADPSAIESLKKVGWNPIDVPPLRRPWTDDYSSATPLFMAKAALGR